MNSISNFIQTIRSIEEVEILFRLVLIVILSGIVGYERQSLKKPAGFRTYVLVGISAVLVMICGSKMHELYGNDSTRIPAQLLSGIGFLGAGTILRDGNNVKGLTTAAGLLSITCIGLIVGAGFYLIGIITTCIVYCVMSYSYVMSEKLDHYNVLELRIITIKPKNVLKEIRKILDEEDIEMSHIKIVENKKENNYINLKIKSQNYININNIISNFMDIDAVREVIEIKQEE